MTIPSGDDRPVALRSGFHRDLEEIDSKVRQLFALVLETLGAGTDAFLSGDRDAAKSLVERDKEVIDGLYQDLEVLVQREFALQAPMARDMRYLLSVLRVVPELERSADLAEHIASRAKRGVASELSPRIRGMVSEMSRIGVDMWRDAGLAWAARDPEAYEALNEADDELDDLHVSLMAEIASGSLSVPVAVEMALVARFYERLGDHAVNVTKRVKYLADGT